MRVVRCTLLWALILAWAFPVVAPAKEKSARFRRLRETMVRDQIQDPPGFRTPVRDDRVLRVLRDVPRHRFVRPGDRDRAYGDHPLPIGYGQTISQPYIVARMTEMLQVKPGNRILEVGTGSGYQAAVLSRLADAVYTVEVIRDLADAATERLARLGYDNVHVRVADGYYGWEQQAPFDRIIVTCAAGLVPPPLIRQLRAGGRMCIPVGSPYAVQYLTLVKKASNGEITLRKELPVRFVPLTRTLR